MAKKPVDKERITLRLLSDAPGDVRDVYRLLKSQPSEVFSEWGACGCKLEMIEKFLGCNNSFAIMFDDKVVGMIGYTYKPKYYVWGFDEKYWLHVLIDRKYSGLGIGTAATELLEKYLKSSTDITQLYSGIYITNAASIRVMEKLGFKKVAQWKKVVVYQKDLNDD